MGDIGGGGFDAQLTQRASAKLAALDRSQAVIEFDLGGHVIAANDNFRHLMGFAAEELIGVHHRIFCEPGEAASLDYEEFWAKLRRGEFHSGEYRRVT